MSEHPAVESVLWTYLPPRCEVAEYKGHRLRVRHLDDARSLGFIDEQLVGSAPNMPKITDMLFRMVDAT